MGVAQVGGFTAGTRGVVGGTSGGFELIAFSPVPPQEAGGKPAPVGPPQPPPPPPPSPEAWQCYRYSANDTVWIAACDKTGKADLASQSQTLT